jgi:hypothetical protein
MSAWLMIVVLGLICAAGIVLATFRLPGTWLILLGAGGYAWYTQGAGIGWWSIAALAGMALVGELVEFFSSLWTARRAGASRRAGWFGLAGGVIGMIVFSIPVPIIGTIVGGALGCAIGAIVGELTVHADLRRGVRIGVFASIGHALGAVAKLWIAMVMAATTMAVAIYSRV